MSITLLGFVQSMNIYPSANDNGKHTSRVVLCEFRVTVDLSDNHIVQLKFDLERCLGVVLKETLLGLISIVLAEGEKYFF